MRAVKRVGIVGLGPIGRAVAEAIDLGLQGYRLSAVASGHAERAAAYSRTLRRPVPVLDGPDIGAVSDIVVECAPSAIFESLARPTLEQGRDLIVLSSGALLTHWDLVELADLTGGTLRVPTGALLGLDAVQAAAQNGLRSVRMTTRKPLHSLLDAPHLHGRSGLATITEPTLLFTGTAREAAEGFPANLNVAVALSLAGLGPDRTEVEIWADPALQRNTHRIDVDAASATFSMSIENVPSENPKTGRITALSVVALLRKLAAPLQIGT
ncbi:probable L-aspartate dehydrogenase [Mycolicibacterium canariasense]|uniref:L-aspartate dehydrogenase n=1 Tax=Mycolicibacterium canariasense TaxID=228230 RepID=A0A117IBG1_MYCCR|nr:aspartate dehydrogenase [Mycolicibacterium canariasense]MCV7212487.1 aspartate dehydrogenase [Mycolicibacterium canariasense]ORV15462.1 aspartate dehydrogenase [Mycolicibacterium canariasense]GAS97939.1 probable L-aspartate dehydrogenase [Mycolicibacterium canariasense]